MTKVISGIAVYTKGKKPLLNADEVMAQIKDLIALCL